MEGKPASEVRLDLSGDDVADELRSLSAWLNGEAALHGRARLASAPPSPGSMGGALESLVVALGPGSIAMAFAGVLIAWLRSRSAEFSVRLTRPDGSSVRLDAKNVRALPQERVEELAGSVTALLAGDAAAAAETGGGNAAAQETGGATGDQAPGGSA